MVLCSNKAVKSSGLFVLHCITLYCIVLTCLYSFINLLISALLLILCSSDSLRGKRNKHIEEPYMTKNKWENLDYILILYMFL